MKEQVFETKEDFNRAKAIMPPGSIDYFPRLTIYYLEEGESRANADEGIETGYAILTFDNEKLAKETIEKHALKPVERGKDYFVVSIPKNKLFDEFKAELISENVFKNIESDNIVNGMSHATTPDPIINQQFMHEKLHSREAALLVPDNVGMLGLIDGHGLAKHPDLDSNIGWTYNAVTDTTDVTPVSTGEKHGTSVAGVMVEVFGNGIGGAGLLMNKFKLGYVQEGYNVQPSGTYFSSTLIRKRALNKMIEMGVLVVGQSTGTTKFDPIVYEACQQLRALGVPYVCSAGNDGSNGGWGNYPASYATNWATASAVYAGTRSGFSNYGKDVNGKGIMFSAYGSGITTIDIPGNGGYNTTDYASLNGTSFSQPMVACAAGVAKGINPRLTVNQVEAIMIEACVHTGGYDYSAGPSSELGYGIPDMLKVAQLATATLEQPVVKKHNLSVTITAPTFVAKGQPCTVGVTAKTDHPELPAVPVSLKFVWSKDGEISADDKVLLTKQFNLGLGNGSWNGKVTALPPSSTGLWNLIASVDYDNVVPEDIESDNIGMAQVMITGPVLTTAPAGTEVTVITSNSNITGQGAYIAVPYNITNTGIPIKNFSISKDYEPNSHFLSPIAQPLASGQSFGQINLLHFPTPGTYHVKISVPKVDGYDIWANQDKATKTIVVTRTS